MHPEISRQQAKLDHLFDQAKRLQTSDGVDREVKVQFVWFLCVRTTGFVESSIKFILEKHVESNTDHQPIVEFVSNQLRFVRGMRSSEILDLVKRFSEEWNKNLDKAFDHRVRSSLGNLTTNRNQIAHGEDVSLTLNELEDYYRDAKEAVRLVEEECNK